MASQQRAALVSGGSRGIGAGIVRRLTSDGIQVAFTYVQSDRQADELARQTGAFAIRADGGDQAAVEESVRLTVERFGGLDIVINNAYAAEVHPLAEFPLEVFDRMMAVNIRGAWIAIQAAEPHLGEGGRIVNIGSVFAQRQPPGSMPGIAAYNLTKAALEGMARGLARELAPRGITVNTVLPGAVDTEALPPHMAELMSQWAPTGRLATTAEVADTVSFLASESASFVTGVSLPVDGGFAA
ncbi:SDR family oxidoreductase [Streptomyces olivaceoviridis]|uniref:SDR family oxidoreductase n=1 Tax=Streptomyces olivaceoviridis TaxID=1921 RepID=UPI00369418ED